MEFGHNSCSELLNIINECFIMGQAHVPLMSQRHFWLSQDLSWERLEGRAGVREFGELADISVALAVVCQVCIMKEYGVGGSWTQFAPSFPPLDPSRKILTPPSIPSPRHDPRPYSDVKRPRLRDSPPLWKGKFDANSPKNWHSRKMGAELTRRVWPFLPLFMVRLWAGITQACAVIWFIRSLYIIFLVPSLPVGIDNLSSRWTKIMICANYAMGDNMTHCRYK